MRQHIPTLFIILILWPGLCINAAPRKEIPLNKNWIVRDLESDQKLPHNLPTDLNSPGKDWYTATLPVQVQELVFEAGELPDPHYGDNAALWTGIFERDWLYATRFKSPDHKGEIMLCFKGLDTKVDVILNGKKIAECNNMHRWFRFRVNEYLNKTGELNELKLRFYAPEKFISDIVEKEGEQDFPAFKYMRKCTQDFGSYLGARPHFLKMGVCDDVYLDLLPEQWLGDVFIQPELNENYSSAELLIDPDVRGNGDAHIRYSLVSPAGEPVKEGLLTGSDNFSIPVEDPILWWPFTYGEPALYRLSLTLENKNGLLDSREFKVGIREIKMYLKDDETGEERFGYRINGKVMFMHGVCWSPLEGFTHVWDEDRANTLLDLLVWGNMNFIRVWGEGSVPGESFFDECDKRGIVVWQEFMTGNGLTFPLDYPGYIDNFKGEIEDNIKRLRNHACLAMWCGGNEHYLGYPSFDEDMSKPTGRELFQDIMPSLVSKFDPGRHFHPSSPWGGEDWPTGNYTLAGDYHDYWTYRFQPNATVPLFTGEVCMVSPYSLHHMKRFMPEEEIWPEDFRFSINQPGKIAWPDGWEKHRTTDAWEKIGKIQDYCDIENAADMCRVFGTAHGQYLRDRYERQRRGIPDGMPDGNRRSWGAAIWRLNDTWPIIYMSVIDYYLEPKIPYYFLKRACDPLLLTFEQTDERISSWVVNDSPEIVNDSLVVELWTFNGTMKRRLAWKVDLQPGESKRVANLTAFHEIRKRDEFFVARMGGREVTHLLWPEKYLNLSQAEIKAEWYGEKIILRSDVFVKDVELRLEGTSGAIYSENFFNLIPGQSKEIQLLYDPGGDKLIIKGVNSVKLVLNR